MALKTHEVAYLKALSEMERLRVPFSHGAMIRVLGYRSTARSHQLMTALLSTAHVEKRDSVVVLGVPLAADKPLLTSKGRKALKKAA